MAPAYLLRSRYIGEGSLPSSQGRLYGLNAHIQLNWVQEEGKAYTFKLKNIVLSFDEDSGAIIQLTDSRNSSTVEWAYPHNPLGVLVYQTFVPADYKTFFSKYFYTSTSYGPPDFGKPGLKDVTKYKVSAKLLT